MVTVPPRLQPQPHVRAAGSSPLRGRGPVSDAPSGSRKKRTTVTVPEEPEQVGQSQALGSARPRVRRPFAEVAAGKEASAGSWGLGPSQRPAAPRRHSVSSAPGSPRTSSIHPRQGTNRTTRCVSESPAGGDRGRRAPGIPQVVALTDRAPRTRQGWRAGSVTREHGGCPEAPAASWKDCQSPRGKKLEGISATTTSHPEPDLNFPPGVGCTAESDPAEAAQTQVLGFRPRPAAALCAHFQVTTRCCHSYASILAYTPMLNVK